MPKVKVISDLILFVLSVNDKSDLYSSCLGEVHIGFNPLRALGEGHIGFNPLHALDEGHIGFNPLYALDKGHTEFNPVHYLYAYGKNEVK